MSTGAWCVLLWESIAAWDGWSLVVTRDHGDPAAARELEDVEALVD